MLCTKGYSHFDADLVLSAIISLITIIWSLFIRIHLQIANTLNVYAFMFLIVLFAVLMIFYSELSYPLLCLSHQFR